MRQYYIDGAEVLISPSWSITDKINTRSTFQIKVVDLGTLTDVQNGDSFEMYIDSVKVFKGLVKKVKVSETSPGYYEYTIKIADNAAKADKRLIADVYENTLAGDIVKDLITQKLSQEGVTIGVIEDGPVIVKAVFNYIKCSQALDQLKELTGFIWNIDSDDQLNFYSRQSNLAPYQLDDNVQHSKFVHERNMDQYRNTNYVRGGLSQTSLQEDQIPSPKPDGASRTFTFRYPLASVPVLRVNSITVNPDDIGVNGVDTGKKWYYNYNSDTITQDTSETVLSTTDAIDGDIIGLRQLFIEVEDAVEIDTRKTQEGGSGIYEYLSIEKSINTTDQGIEFGNSQIEIYGTIQDYITFDTTISGLEAGQLLKCVKIGYNINEDFLIESVIMKPDGPKNIKYSVKALDGASIGGWEEFFKDLLKRSTDFVIAENDVIILLQTQSETTEVGGSLNIKVFEPPVCNVGLKVGTFKVGGSTLSEVNVLD